MEEKKNGLFVKGQLMLEVQAAKEAHALIKKRVIGGLSIGFESVLSRFHETKRIREIFQVRLHEVSIVTWPANPEAEIISVKSAA